MAKNKKMLVMLAAFLLVGGSLFAQAGDKTYSIGDVGPAGGIIFFDQGSFQNGWRYLEAAPASAEFEAKWSGKKIDVPGLGTSVGSGKRNTQLIVEEMNKKKEKQSAALQCSNLEINGFKDWYLPSIDELVQLYVNRERIGGFQNSRYWSSSQHNKGSAKTVVFGLEYAFVTYLMPGTPSDNNKPDTRRVRPIRAF